MLIKAIAFAVLFGSLSAFGSVTQVNLDVDGKPINDKVAISSLLSSDGQSVFFTTGSKLYKRNLKTGQIQVIDSLMCSEDNWAFTEMSLIVGVSNDDQTLVYYDKCNVGPHRDLYELAVLNLTTGSRKVFVSSNTPMANWALSPDGRYLAHILDAQRFAINDLQTGATVTGALPAGAYSMNAFGFSLDGKYLSYSPVASTGISLFIYDVTAKTQRQIDFPALPLTGLGCNLLGENDAVCTGNMTVSPFTTTMVRLNLTTLQFDYINKDAKGQSLAIYKMILSNDGRYLYFDAQNPVSPVTIDSLYRRDLTDGTVTNLIPHIVSSANSSPFFAFDSVNWAGGEKVLFGSAGCDVIPTDKSCTANAYIWSP